MLGLHIHHHFPTCAFPMHMPSCIIPIFYPLFIIIHSTVYYAIYIFCLFLNSFDEIHLIGLYFVTCRFNIFTYIKARMFTSLPHCISKAVCIAIKNCMAMIDSVSYYAEKPSLSHAITR